MPSVNFGPSSSIQVNTTALMEPSGDTSTQIGDLSVDGDTITPSAGALIVADANVVAGTIGNGFQVAEGTDAKQGVSVLVAGTLLVANTSVTASSRIFLTAQVLGTVVVPSALAISARVAGVSFTILASDAADTSTVAWEIFEPSS